MRRAYIAIVVLVVLVLALYFGDFALAKSETYSTAQVGGSKDANATFSEGFCVYPDSPFGNLVADELRAGGHKVLILSAPVECDGQFLAVWVEGLNISYSPVLSKGRVRAVAVYSSAGDPTHYINYRNAMDKRTALTSFEKTGRAQFQAYIIAEVSDESEGFIAFKGYQDYLLRRAAEVIAHQAERFELEGKTENGLD
ncbi:hypothetical protein APY94_05515 [Thermococcus celericrescens]|uniref:Uncharacterized protein n=1 Tax=Thermococcus celericrescens TaxID=227598 RepID=A0A100XYE5_9EURY|nr:hypothetical protein [Thermococcus celericrescens]KUH33652.1 hypothetical protein APY94_05515 [Thermococcus celericrescens]